MEKVVDYCGCYVDYIEAEMLIVIPLNLKACNFFQHAVCVSEIIDNRQPSKNVCLPPCQSFKFSPVTLQVNLLKKNAQKGSWDHYVARELFPPLDFCIHNTVRWSIQKSGVGSKSTLDYKIRH